MLRESGLRMLLFWEVIERYNQGHAIAEFISGWLMKEPIA